MAELQSNDVDAIASAVKAVEQLFNDTDAANVPGYEPQDLTSARAAVRRLGELFSELPGTIAQALDTARRSGELLSPDRLQGLAEILQNADDAGATEVRLLLWDGHLLMAHNGHGIQLRHVLGLATPWHSTKRGDVESIGRFGIGLSALRSLAETVDVHSSPYHLRLGAPILSPIGSPTLPGGFDEDGWTVFCIPVTESDVPLDSLTAWLDRWGDAGLLFLRNVAEVQLYGDEGAAVRRLSVRRDSHTIIHGDAEVGAPIRKQRVGAQGPDSWMVYSAEVPAATGVSRVHKATGSATTIGVALPLYQAEQGKVYAGLPVVNTPLPLFVNAQFDPLTSRGDLADTAWNRALVPLVANIWVVAAVDLFRLRPEQAWAAIPIGADSVAESMSTLVAGLNEAIIQSARSSVAEHAAVHVPSKGWLGFDRLAVEIESLEGVVTADETAALLDMPATLPSTARDARGRWRAVLADWREAGADLPAPLTVEQALKLLRDMSRPVQSTISLTAAGIRDGLGDEVASLPCLVTSDGKRLVPPTDDSPEAVALEVSPLAGELEIVAVLHAQYGDVADDSTAVVEWLRENGALLDGTDDREVVRRLATAGKSGRRVAEPLTDAQLIGLRRAVELLDPDERRELGHDVGRAIALEAYVYEVRRGRRQPRQTAASPIEAYLPRSIDRAQDSFAIAAERAPNIIWLSDHYARGLRSPDGRAGMGAQRFLTLLGAATAPRPRAHPGLTRRFASPLLGLHRSATDSSSGRAQAMEDQGATYTLTDTECPDLIATLSDIARGRRGKTRRTRARAVLATLGRAWERLSDFAEVVSADDYFTWNHKGRIPAFWLWQAREIAWLDDESGKARRPSELRIRTPGTEAIYGEDSKDFVHPELAGAHPERRSWLAAMAALGMSGDPTGRELVARLKELRDGFESGVLSTDRVERDSAIIYMALAAPLGDSTARSDLSEAELRKAFQDGDGLLFTDSTWWKPDQVFAGPPVFGAYEAFAPPVSGTVPLWRTLRLKEPSLLDCIEVLRRIARRRRPLDTDDEAIQIQTLRLLEARFRDQGGPKDRRRLAKLRLWTSLGWKTERPVFATDDELLVAGLRDRLPIWQPGGELDQFRSLLSPLRVTEIGANDAVVVDPNMSQDDAHSTGLFRAAVWQLKEDLVRNEPDLANSLGIPWEALTEFDLRRHPALTIEVRVPTNADDKVLECDVLVRVDVTRRIVFAKDPAVDLPRADGGGRALASLFSGDPRRLAQAWRVAWDQAEAGRTAKALELAQQRAARKQEEIDANIEQELAALQARTADKRSSTARKSRSGTTKSADDTPVTGEPRRELEEARVLVDPGTLKVADLQGRLVDASPESATSRPTPQSVRLAEPRATSQSPRNRVQTRSYSDLDRENVGLELARMVLASDREDIIDLRTQCGVGADAMDKLKRFYELKVSAGVEPDQIRLTNAEVLRAQSSPHFFLVVVSGVEGAAASPTVRIIPRPLDQLQQAVTGTMTLSGVSRAKSVVYDLVPLQASTPPEVGTIVDTPPG